MCRIDQVEVVRVELGIEMREEGRGNTQRHKERWET